MNHTLESIARALFKSWFIDFDPVRAKMDGRQPADMDAETAALFPDEFEDSSSGRIPKNWIYISLSEMTDKNTPITYRVVKPGPTDENGVLFIRGGDIENSQIKIEQLRTITKDISEQYKRTVLRGGEILISLVGNPGQFAVVPDSLKGCNIARQVGLIRLKDNHGVQYIKHFLESPVGQIELLARSLGSVQQVINLKDLKTLRIINPGNKLIKCFEDTVSPLYRKGQINLEQDRTLCAIRDAFLPKLLSGEIRLKDAEEVVEAVV
jgi:type I restriction enzyme S subunit